MFTGLIEGIGTVREVGSRRSGRRLGIAPPFPVDALADGESVAVDGVCLTVASRGRDRFVVDVIPETLARTRLGRLRTGDRVNLERALRLGDRLGGHLVQGHVDAVARVDAVLREGGEHRLRVTLEPEIAALVARKGSVAVNGVSLTVASVAAKTFDVALIPETLARTNLGGLRRGDPVHVEADLLARYLERLWESRAGDPTPAPGSGGTGTP